VSVGAPRNAQSDRERDLEAFEDSRCSYLGKGVRISQQAISGHGRTLAAGEVDGGGSKARCASSLRRMVKVVSMEKGEAARVFISYRRQETALPARELYDVLVAELGADRVFKDVDDIQPGDDFVERIQSAVGSCQVLLTLIGPQWLTITDAKGARRLDDPQDFVRLEVETALNRDDVRVIPILVDNARMPTAQELPEGLAALSRRQAVEINRSALTRVDFCGC
jgi:TIR domain